MRLPCGAHLLRRRCGKRREESLGLCSGAARGPGTPSPRRRPNSTGRGRRRGDGAPGRRDSLCGTHRREEKKEEGRESLILGALASPPASSQGEPRREKRRGQGREESLGLSSRAIQGEGEACAVRTGGKKREKSSCAGVGAGDYGGNPVPRGRGRQPTRANQRPGSGLNPRGSPGLEVVIL